MEGFLILAALIAVVLGIRWAMRKTYEAANRSVFARKAQSRGRSAVERSRGFDVDGLAPDRVVASVGERLGLEGRARGVLGSTFSMETGGDATLIFKFGNRFADSFVAALACDATPTGSHCEYSIIEYSTGDGVINNGKEMEVLENLVAQAFDAGFDRIGPAVPPPAVVPAEPREPPSPVAHSQPAQAAAPDPVEEPDSDRAGDTVRPPQPTPGVFTLVFDDGRREEITGDGLVGREPEMHSRSSVSHVIDLDDPGRTVSKNHLTFGVDNEVMWLTDQSSTNGSTIDRTDGSTDLLSAFVRTHAGRGDTVRLGDRWFRIE